MATDAFKVAVATASCQLHGELVEFFPFWNLHSGNASCKRSNTNPSTIPQMIVKHVTEAYGTSSSKKMPYACAGCASTSPAPAPKASTSNGNPFCFCSAEVPLRATTVECVFADESSGAATSVLFASSNDHIVTAPTIIPC